MAGKDDTISAAASNAANTTTQTAAPTVSQNEQVTYIKRSNAYWMSAAFAVGGAVAGALGMSYMGRPKKSS